MDTEAQAALARFVREMSESLSRLAAALEGEEVPGGAHYGPAHLKLPWAERVLRQSLIIQDIVAEGGSVTKERWYEIAGRYGYSGRGLAGFFRGGNQGLLEMRRERVYVTKHGKERLAQNLSRVEGARENEPAA